MSDFKKYQTIMRSEEDGMLKAIGASRNAPLSADEMALAIGALTTVLVKLIVANGDPMGLAQTIAGGLTRSTRQVMNSGPQI